MTLFFLTRLLGRFSTLLPKEVAVLVIGHKRLARGLSKRGYDVHLALPPSTKVKSIKGVSLVVENFDSLTTENGMVDAVVTTSDKLGDRWYEECEEWAKTLKSGGRLILVARKSPALCSRKLLCGGMRDLIQFRVGRVVVTSGLGDIR